MRSGVKARIWSRNSKKPSVKPSIYCRSYSFSSTITFMIAFSRATSVPGRNCSMWRACRFIAVPRGSMTISSPPRLANCLKKVAATGWFSVGLAPMTMARSAFSISLKVAVTAPEPTFSISAATDEAWQSRVQWSTLLWPKP